MTLKHLAGISFTALALALSACGDQTQSSQSPSLSTNQMLNPLWDHLALNSQIWMRALNLEMISSAT